MPPKSTNLLHYNALWCAKILIFAAAVFLFVQNSQGQANSIRTGVNFNWADTQTTLNDPANLQSINIGGVDYTTFVVPSSYEMTTLGPGGHNQNNIWINGTQTTSGSDDPNWSSDALDAYQSLNLNHYFQSNSAGENFCNDYTAVATTNAQVQTIRYLPGIPSNPDGVIAITERGGNNCMYIELYGIPVGGGPEQLLGRTFVRNEFNLTGVGPQVPPSTNSDYWSSGRNNENNQIIGIALYHLSELAPVGSVITSIRYIGATTDHGDGKFFLMQTYAEDDSIEIKLDREGNGDIAANDMVPTGSSYSLTSGTSNGTLTFNTDGTFNYIPNPGYTGNDSFEYQVCLPAPNSGVCDSGTAIIIIKLEAIFDNLNVAQNTLNNRVNVLDNDNFGSSGLQPNGAITNFSLPINGSIALNDNGTPTDSNDDYFTYSPNNGFIGTDTFTYEITDAGGGTDIASVYISTAFDTDTDGIDDNTDLDDDNDGMLDSTEGLECIDDDYFAWEFNTPVGNRSNDFVQNPAITNWLITTTSDVTTGAGVDGNSPASELQLTNMDATTYAEAIALDEYVQVSFTTANGLINPLIERIGLNWFQNSGGSAIGNSYDVALTISNDNFATSILLYSDLRIHYPTNGISEFFDLFPVGSTFNLEENTTYTLRVYTYNQQNDGNVAYSVFDDLTVRVSACQEQNNDSDTIPDQQDLDSDGDGIPDNVESQTTLGYTAPNADNVVTYLSNDGVNSAYLGGLLPTNTDATDNPDYLDADSDNDGLTDLEEALKWLVGLDADLDGLDERTDEDLSGYLDSGGTIDNPLSAPIILPDEDGDANSGGDVDFRDATDDRPDNDADGIPDVVDFDDDNDGILDTEEGCGNLILNSSFERDDFADNTVYNNAGANGAYIGADLNADQITAWDYSQNMDAWVEGGTWAPAYHGSQYMDLIGAATRSGGIMNEFRQVINTVPGNTYTLSLYWGEDWGHAPGSNVDLQVAIIDDGNTTIMSDNQSTVAQGSIGGVRGPNRWFHYENTFVATTSQTTVLLTSDAPAPNFYSGANIDFVSVTVRSPSTCQDTDGDGVIDSLDLDSDNDGIFDAEEAGHGQPHINGVVSGSVGSDGIPDAVQNNSNSEIINYVLAESADDTDTIPNFLDLDADGDGIPDNVEAQTTIGYIPPSGTVDANGVDSTYTVGLNPTNTDGADNPDYLDLDSDNEGGDDTTEAAMILSGNDVDNDGLDDATDATPDHSDVGGTIDNPLVAPVILPDTDSDATTGGDVDFRDAIDDVIIDLDTDDDGILDSVEDMNTDGDNDPATNPTNSDNDVYPDYLDIDSDNDGIPDNVEAQTTSGYIPPSLIDANDNGVDDAYETPTGLGLVPINTDGIDVPDYLDTDSDNDNVPDAIEGNDQNHDGIPDLVFIGSDKDDDGLDDSFEGIEQIDVDVNDEIDDPISDLPNTDGDAESDYRDLDDDGDGIPTMDEDTNGDMDYANDDWDNDGIPDYLDPDPEVEVDDVEIFNVVTPNGDGIHDALVITGLETRPENSLQIYNRWGILVYSTKSYNTSSNVFDGTSQARATVGKKDRLPVGTYFYLFNYVEITGETINLSGHLYLN